MTSGQAIGYILNTALSLPTIKGKIWEGTLPTGFTQPCANYNYISGNINFDQAYERWQINARHSTQEGALALALLMEKVLQDYSGVLTGIDIQDTTVDQRLCRQEPDLSWACPIDILIHY
jgi:hypothetical protein